MSRPIQADVAIVGGGPAGLSAALEVAEAGAHVVLVDEHAELGGQFFKRVAPSLEVVEPRQLGKQYTDGSTLIDRVRQAGVEVLTHTLVWGIYDGTTLALADDHSAWTLQARAVVLAPGAYELSVPMPGWTLPGVLTGGAAQTLLVSQRVLPGRRVVMAGVGPLQLRVASQLLEAGVEVVALVDAARSPVSVENALKALGHWGKMREGLDYWRKLERANIPLLYEYLPVRILGSQQVEGVVVAAVTDAWRPRPGTEQTFEVDTVCLTYGFVPAVQLARLAGCELTYDAAAGGWTTSHDELQRTTVAGVYVAGEISGIGGSDVALEEGRIAGLAIAQELCYRESVATTRRLADARKRLGKHRQFVETLRRMTALKPGLFELAAEDTVICRCEDVTAGEVRTAVEAEPTLRGLKQLTRAGMGPCQGRVCAHLLTRLVASAAGCPYQAVELDTPRPPVRPVPISVLYSIAAEAEG